MLLVVVAACSGDGATDTSNGEVTTAPPATSTTVAATSTTATVAPVTSTTVVVADPGEGCVGCHTDEASLRALAMEPIDTEVLSEGEG